MNLAVIGPSGSGKGTQAALLSKQFGIPTVSTGKLFRQALKKKTPDGIRAAQEYWLKGKWAPTDLTLKLLGPVLDKSQKGFILDGFPRVPDQPAILKGYLSKSKRKIDRVIHLRLSDKEAIKRLFLRAKKEKKATGRARPDETEAAIKERLKSYHQTSQPILGYYQKRGILEDVDGERPIEVIFEDVMSRLKKAGLVKQA